MYTATKHYGKKTGQFKTVLGYVTDEKVKRIRDMRTNEYLPCSQCYPTTPLMYLLLFKQSKATVCAEKCIRLLLLSVYFSIFVL